MNLPGRRRLVGAAGHGPMRLSLVASVQSGDATKNVPQQKLRRLYQEWHPRALATYDTVGECWYPSQFYARSLAKTRWFPALLNDKGEPEEVEEGPLADLFARIRDPGTAGRSELAASYGRLQFLNGDGYLTVTQDDDGEAWEYLSVMELKIDPTERADQPQRYRRLRAPGATPEELTEAPDSEFEALQGDEVRVWRLWRPHPAHSRLADAPIRSVLDLYELLHRLTLAAAGEASSRAAQRGALVVANEISDAYKQQTNDPDDDPESDPFLGALVEALTNGIQNPGTAEALSPLLIRGPAAAQTPGGVVSLKDMVFWMALGPAGAYTEGDMWDKTIQRIGNGLDLPREFLTGVEKANHWCVDDQTEILTADGWRRHDNVNVGDEVLTLNHETGMSEWQPVLDLARFEVDDLEMLSIEGRCHSSLTTMNHRWPTVAKDTCERRWKISETLNTNDQIVTGAVCADIPTEPIHSDALVELAAWVWTEGQIRSRPGRTRPVVSIYQSAKANAANVASIRRALTSHYGPATEGWLAPHGGHRHSDVGPRWREVTSDRGLTEFRLNAEAGGELATLAPNRVIASTFIRELTAYQLGLFIDISLRADGSQAQPLMFQKNSRLLGALELAAILLGRSVNSYEMEAKGFTTHVMQCLAIHKRNRFGPKPKHKAVTQYTGTIWCPVTKNTSWLSRRHGHVAYTGNTGWLIDEQGYRQHIAPVSERFCNDLASAYLRPAARAAGFADWERVVVGYDPADAILHPDKVQTAFDAHDRLVVSDAYVLEAIGATEEDVPSDEELERRIMVLLKQDPYATEGDEQEGETPPQQGGTGGDTVKGPPSPPVNGNTQTDSGAPGVQTASALQAAMIIGAAQMQVERARELAGTRLIRRSQSCAECKEKIAMVPSSLVASALGIEQVRDVIDGHTTEPQLVGGVGAGFANTLRTWGVEAEWPEKLGRLVEEHALRTLYDEVPPPLSANFASVVAKALR